MPALPEINFTLEDFQEAARTYREELLRLPIIALEEILPYVTVRPGIRYSESVASASLDGVQLAPYKPNLKSEAVLNIAMRELKTYFGTINLPFEPNQAIQTILGHRAFQASGDALSDTPTAKEVLALLIKGIARSLLLALWTAKRDPSGKTTKDLFDGWDTITEKEIANGAISAANKNYLKLSTAINNQNAVDIFKQIMYALTPELRAQECFIYVPQEYVDAYNEAYLLTHPAVAYNTKYNQVSVEGSNGRLTFVPLLSKAGSKFIHISVKENMLIGVDQMSDAEQVRVKDYEPDTLTMMVRMFWGEEFESVDGRRLMVVELPGAAAEVPEVPEP